MVILNLHHCKGSILKRYFGVRKRASRMVTSMPIPLRPSCSRKVQKTPEAVWDWRVLFFLKFKKLPLTTFIVERANNFINGCVQIKELFYLDIILAGLPTTTAPSGTSLRTTDPDPIKLKSPMVIFSLSVALLPIWTALPT